MYAIRSYYDRLPHKYRYIAQRAVIELQDPAFGVSVNDQIRFIEVNYDPDFCPLFAGDDIEWPSVHQTDIMSVQELVDSLPKERGHDVAPSSMGVIRRRITSYNVCYTKLLRIVWMSR